MDENIELQPVQPSIPNGNPTTTLTDQILAMCRLRILLTLRTRVTVIAAVAGPIIALAVALGMSSAIQSSIDQKTGGDAALVSLMRNPTPIPLTAAALASPNPKLYPLLADTPLEANWVTTAVSAYIQSSLNVAQDTSTVVNWTKYDSLSQLSNDLILRTAAQEADNPTGAGLFVHRVQSVSTGSDPSSFTLLYSQDVFSPDAAILQNAVQNTLQSTFAANESLFTSPTINPLPMLTDPPRVDISANITPSFLVYGLVFLIPFYATQLVVFRQRHYRLHLRLAGLSPMGYWYGHAIIDSIVYIIPVIVTLIALSVAKLPFFVESSTWPFLLLFFSFGPALIGLAYVLSFAFEKPQSCGPVLGFGTALLVFIPYFIVEFAFDNTISDAALYLITLLIPMFGMYRGMANIGSQYIARTPYTTSDAFSFQKPILPLTLLFILQGIVYTFLVAVLDHKNLAQISFKESFMSFIKRHRPTTEPRVEDDEEAEALFKEDPLLIQERARINQGRFTDQDLVKIQNLWKIYPGKGLYPDKVVIKDLCVTIRRNECFGYLGPNGVGKSTLMSILVGLSRATKGQFTLGDYTSTATQYDHRMQAQLGICPQSDVQFDMLTPYEHLDFMLQFHPYLGGKAESKAQRHERIQKTLREVSIKEENHTRYAKTLSGGQRRSLSLALAVVHNPALALLDEPSSALDPKARKQIWETIGRIKRERSVMLTTHSMEEAEALCDRLAIVVNGRIRTMGTPSRLVSVHGRGYKLSIRCASAALADQVKVRMTGILPGAKVAAHFGAALVYDVDEVLELGKEAPNALQNRTTLAVVFLIMAEMTKQKLVSDYDVTQANLEQVFIEYAQTQKL